VYQFNWTGKGTVWVDQQVVVGGAMWVSLDATNPLFCLLDCWGCAAAEDIHQVVAVLGLGACTTAAGRSAGKAECNQSLQSTGRSAERHYKQRWEAEGGS